MINDRMNDDEEMCKRMRCIYSTGNMVARKFAKCSIACKNLMFKTFLSQIYCCSLWTTYKVASYRKVKVAYNDIFRSLHQIPRYESASTLFASYNVNNLDAVIRSNCYSLLCRIQQSNNSIISAIYNSEARVLSRMWHQWGISLGRHLL